MSTPSLVENDTLNVLQLPKLSALQYWTRWVGGHLEFDLSWSSEVNFNFPPHLKIILMVCTNYVRSFMLFSKSAQFSQIRELIRSTTITEDSTVGTVNGMEEVCMCMCMCAAPAVQHILTLVVAKQEFELTIELEMIQFMCTHVSGIVLFITVLLQLQAFYQLQYQQLEQTLVRVFFNHICTIHIVCMYVCRDKLIDPEHSCCCWDSP